MSSCSVCKVSRWKKNSKKEDKEGILAKVLWYVPLILRLKFLFSNKEHVRNLKWHGEERIKDEKL